MAGTGGADTRARPKGIRYLTADSMRNLRTSSRSVKYFLTHLDVWIGILGPGTNKMHRPRGDLELGLERRYSAIDPSYWCKLFYARHLCPLVQRY